MTDFNQTPRARQHLRIEAAARSPEGLWNMLSQNEREEAFGKNCHLVELEPVKGDVTQMTGRTTPYGRTLTGVREAHNKGIAIPSHIGGTGLIDNICTAVAHLNGELRAKYDPEKAGVIY
jgi:hypothetical protein